MIANIKKNIEEYAVGKTWYYYVLPWLFGAYLFVHIALMSPDKQPPLPVAIASSFDFMLHELAHIVTAFLPQMLTAAAGSASELLLGLLLIVVAFRTKGYFASLFCFLWLMLACQSVGIYMADAVSGKLELFSLGAALSGSDEAQHDWVYIFSELHILGMAEAIGGLMRFFGVVVGLFGLVFSAWIMFKMASAGQKPQQLTGQEAILLEQAMADAKRHSSEPRQ